MPKLTLWRCDRCKDEEVRTKKPKGWRYWNQRTRFDEGNVSRNLLCGKCTKEASGFMKGKDLVNQGDI